MGYTKGRMHTDESLRDIAKQYKTRSEFQLADPSAYRTCRLRGDEFLNSACDHMVKGSYSTPQLMCKHILETLFGERCEYNTKKIIPPYELDVYFPKYKLAVEYNGMGWHHNEDVVSRDNIKKKLCEDSGISLVVVVENNRNYEDDVKTQLINNIDLINHTTGNSYTESQIIDIDCSDVYDYILNMKDIDSIKRKISECESIADFQKKYVTEYNFLRVSKKLHMLDDIRICVEYTDEELLDKCKEIFDFSDFLKNHSGLYQRCYKRNLMDIATSHMKRNKKPYVKLSDQELLKMANAYGMKICMLRGDGSLYYEIKRRNLMNDVVYDSNFQYKHVSEKLKEIKEDKLKKIFEEVGNYNSYEEFQKNKELFEQCKKYKILKQVISLYPTPDIPSEIIKNSKSYNGFEEFVDSVWYLKSKKFPGLIQRIKKENGWNYYTKGKINHMEKFPEICDLINSGIPQTEISKTTGINVTTIWRIKNSMFDAGVLKVEFNTKKSQ